ncbi:lysozyme inhibitor LprI family protein [Oryzifoliimicrobium ureilyticus]|uniref:lysozyme inhibitor LprI family protein n=1 Tax=Oryzifoliimicrobium ureilyticus TaxID=3113724 RepID=UPI0030765EFB
MRKLLIALVLLLPASHASADAIYDKCMDESGGTNYGFGKCGGEWVARADAKLNQVWKDLMARLGDRADAKQSLLEEQRAWNTYKESSCTFYQSDFGREGQVIHYPACRAGVIEQRIKDLEDYGSDF